MGFDAPLKKDLYQLPGMLDISPPRDFRVVTSYRGLQEFSRLGFAMYEDLLFGSTASLGYDVLKYSQPLGQFLFSGGTSSIRDRSGLQIGTTMQYGPVNLGSQPYNSSAYDMVGYGFPFSSHATVNFSLPSSFPSFLTLVPGYSIPTMPPVISRPDYGRPTFDPF